MEQEKTVPDEEVFRRENLEVVPTPGMLILGMKPNKMEPNYPCFVFGGENYEFSPGLLMNDKHGVFFHIKEPLLKYWTGRVTPNVSNPPLLGSRRVIPSKYGKFERPLVVTNFIDKGKFSEFGSPPSHVFLLEFFCTLEQKFGIVWTYPREIPRMNQVYRLCAWG